MRRLKSEVKRSAGQMPHDLTYIGTLFTLEK